MKRNITPYQVFSNSAIQGIMLPMTALIIDTSGPEGVIAHADEGKIIHSITLPQGRELSKNLFSSLRLFDKIKFDFIAVGKGPGTFTGTRVGAITAQALAFGWDIPLVAFSSALLPDLNEIALSTYQSFTTGAASSQIELVYISPTT
jgi:tRNA threonylcarbamoyl adenosine modification protein YeaZ